MPQAQKERKYGYANVRCTTEVHPHPKVPDQPLRRWTGVTSGSRIPIDLYVAEVTLLVLEHGVLHHRSPEGFRDLSVQVEPIGNTHHLGKGVEVRTWAGEADDGVFSGVQLEVAFARVLGMHEGGFRAEFRDAFKQSKIREVPDFGAPFQHSMILRLAP